MESVVSDLWLYLYKPVKLGTERRDVETAFLSCDGLLYIFVLLWPDRG